MGRRRSDHHLARRLRHAIGGSECQCIQSNPGKKLGPQDAANGKPSAAYRSANFDLRLDACYHIARRRLGLSVLSSGLATGDVGRP